MPDDVIRSIEPSQAETVRALQSGLATGEHDFLRRIDTNLAHIFIGHHEVYKLKRAVRLPFADQSTLQQRHAVCLAELAANRVWASSLYRSVQPVVLRPDGALRVGEAGDPVDWVVVMDRFPDGALFSELAARGELTANLVSQLAATVARIHRVLPQHLEAGHAADYVAIIQGLRRTETSSAASLGVRMASDDLFKHLESEFRRLSPLIETRRRAGCVRRGHGDLHLSNIFVRDGLAVPFDALEFDPRLATSDVLYDIAFLLMDLVASSAPELACVAMNRYWDESGTDEAALALLPAFMALRAAVQVIVHVTAGRLAAADRYRRLAAMLLRHDAPQAVAIGGLSGSGKSTLARAVAPALRGPCGARLIASDIVRKALAGVAPDEKLGAEHYEPGPRAFVYRAMAERVEAAIAAGSSVVADATFRDAAERERIEAAAGQAGLRGMWLWVPAEMRVARVSHRHGGASDADVEVARAQTEPADLGADWRRLDGTRPVNAQLRELLVHLSAPAAA